MNRKIKMSIVDKYFETIDKKEVVCYIKTISASIKTLSYYATGFIRTIRATAKWDGTGKFDYNFAQKLALARAEIKARKYYKNIAKELLADELERCNMLKAFIEQCDNQIIHNKNYINNLIKSFDK